MEYSKFASKYLGCVTPKVKLDGKFPNCYDVNIAANPRVHFQVPNDDRVKMSIFVFAPSDFYDNGDDVVNWGVESSQEVIEFLGAKRHLNHFQQVIPYQTISTTLSQGHAMIQVSKALGGEMMYDMRELAKHTPIIRVFRYDFSTTRFVEDAIVNL